MTFCSVSWPSSNASIDVSAEARRKEKFLEGKTLVNGCLVFLEKSVEKIIFSKKDLLIILMWENFERLWAKWGAILEKSQTGIMRVRG